MLHPGGEKLKAQCPDASSDVEKRLPAPCTQYHGSQQTRAGVGPLPPVTLEVALGVGSVELSGNGIAKMRTAGSGHRGSERGCIKKFPHFRCCENPVIDADIVDGTIEKAVKQGIRPAADAQRLHTVVKEKSRS